MPAPAVQALAREVIRRLELRVAALGQPDATPDAAAISRLCDALASGNDEAATAMVMEATNRGMSIDTASFAYLGGAARMLGVWWDEDRLSSAEMTIAAIRIYAILRGLRRLFTPPLTLMPDAFRALFVAPPGETHTLGVTMAADYFRRRGWDIDLKTGYMHEELLQQIDHRQYPVIGLSASSQRMIFPLARLVVALRISNPGALFMISGKITDLEPDIVSLVDADCVANDAETAESMMQAHIAAPAAQESARQ